MVTLNSIKNAIRAYFKQNGKTPTPTSGDATRYFGSRMTWKAVNTSLKKGTGGLPGGSSLTKLSKEMEQDSPFFRIPTTCEDLDESWKKSKVTFVIDEAHNPQQAPSKPMSRPPSVLLIIQRMGRLMRRKK